jgi:diguanylate cyclase (GGDEF)-like protein
MGQPARMLAPRELWAPRQAADWRSFSSWRRRSLAQRKDGRIFQVERVSDVVTDLAGHPLGLVTCSEDVTERLLIEERIRFLALHDPLTRLPNRALFSDRIGQALGRARHGSGQLAILLVNLDRFRAINDTLGQFAGDQLLQEIAAELQEIAGPDSTVARIGGDEFGILLPAVAGEAEAVALAERAIAAVAEPRRVLGHELRVTASGGVAIFPDCGDDPEALLSEADRALVVAKNAGRNTVQVSPGFGEATGGRHLAMEMALHQAVEREQLDLRYQPVVAWPSGRVVGVEALVRWRHPVWGEIAPREFIPLAEMSGSVVPLGEWVLREACRRAAAWPQSNGEAARVAVNLSPVQLRQADLPAMVGRVLAETGLDPRRLEIEITESGAMQDLEVTLAVLRELRAMELTLTVDDFGTGHSSLSYLKLLPIHRLKVDQAFVRNLANEDSDAAIVSATIAMAHSLGLTVVAEGVESLEQAQMLERFGCDELQGYWFSAPLSAAEVQAMFEDPAGRAPQVYA